MPNFNCQLPFANILHLNGKIRKNNQFFRFDFSILFLSPLPTERLPEILHLNEPLVDATIRVYSTITCSLLPTPAKSHYTFNLRDLSKVFQGILMADVIKIEVWKSHGERLVLHLILHYTDRHLYPFKF